MPRLHTGKEKGKEKGKDWVYKKVLSCRAHTSPKGPQKALGEGARGRGATATAPYPRKKKGFIIRVSLLLCCPEAVGRGGGGAELFVD